MNFKQEQLIVIFTTVVSLITAWSWNNFFQEYIKTYYGNSLSTNFLVAVITTIIMFYALNWTLRHMDYDKDTMEKMEKKMRHIQNGYSYKKTDTYLN